MTGHPRYGAPDHPIGEALEPGLPEESGSRDRGPVGEFLPRRACDLKVPEEPLQLRRGGYTADTNANIARGAQHAKEMEGREKGAHREGAV